MSRFPRIAPIVPEDPEPVTLLTDEDIKKSADHIARAMYDALRHKEPLLAEFFALEYQRMMRKP